MLGRESLLELEVVRQESSSRAAQLSVTVIATVSFSKVVLSQGAVFKVFLGVFLMFLAFFHSKIWAKFHFGTFEP